MDQRSGTEQGELVERLVLSLTSPGDLLVDPFVGVGSSIVAAIIHGRRAAGADLSGEYLSVARKRIVEAAAGKLKIRTMQTPVFDYRNAGKALLTAPWLVDGGEATIPPPPVSEWSLMEGPPEKRK